MVRCSMMQMYWTPCTNCSLIFWGGSVSARGFNKAILIGRGQPNYPGLRYTQSGQAVCSFKLVTDESYKDKEGNMVERAEWHHIVAWGKAGEIIAQYAKKGSQMFI